MMRKNLLIVFALLMLAAACGDTADDKRAPGSPGNGGSTFGGGGSGGSGEPGSGQMDPSTNVSCPDACENATNWCGAQLGTYEECVSVCPEMGQSMLNCIGNADGCDGVTSCLEGEGGAGNGGTGGGDGNNDSSQAAIGSECFGDLECQSGYCRKPAGASFGQCAVNDFGEVCQTDADCNGQCAYRDGTNDVSGLCTYTCDSDSDCPNFWDCVQYSNGAASVCWEG